MEQKEDETGIQISTPNNSVESTYPVDELSQAPSAVQQSKLPKKEYPARRAVAKGVQGTLSKTSMLANWLPTGTLLTFEMIIPSVVGSGLSCTSVRDTMMIILLCLCGASCFFFHFTDSFKGPDGKVYYGYVTPTGLAVFKPDLGVHTPKDENYKLKFSDFVHALMSVAVFAAIVAGDRRVTDCLFRKHVKEIDEAMESVPLIVGVICSGLYLVFPNTRYGIGCVSI
ncbi:hypothetical protein MKW98_016982 [Papaver atlanticum]|uniref:Uncharacterized protein n=1 Tax=Papaver atlanticum TaxID=357466 RepID=A0AAD4TK55_9MAGN|nr:hypothetical protein MKW98_016982 [Papaver atlanticum]